MPPFRRRRPFGGIPDGAFVASTINCFLLLKKVLRELFFSTATPEQVFGMYK